MEKTPYRTYLTWMAWLEKEWNEPNRTDNYLMQIAREIWHQRHPKAQSTLLDKFKIKFGIKKAPAPTSPEDKLAASKSAWFAFLGIKGKK